MTTATHRYGAKHGLSLSSMTSSHFRRDNQTMDSLSVVLEDHKASVTAFNGNRSESDNWITDGHVLIPMKAVKRKKSVLINRHKKDPIATVNGEKIQPIWDSAVSGCTHSARLYSTETILTGSKIPALQFVAREDTVSIYSVFVDVRKLALLVHVTGADSIRSEANNRAVTLYRDSVPVALLMPLRPDIEQPIKTAGELAKELAKERTPEVYTPSKDKKDSWTYHDVTFESWMVGVDTAVYRLVGISVHDLADTMFRDAYDDGCTAYDMAIEALENDDIGARMLAEIEVS